MNNNKKIEDFENIDNELLDNNEDLVEEVYVEEPQQTYAYEEEPKLGEEQFNRTLDDKDYYKNRDEELQHELEEAQAEAERDEKTIPAPDKDEDSEEKEGTEEENNEDNSTEENTSDSSDNEEIKDEETTNSTNKVENNDEQKSSDEEDNKAPAENNDVTSQRRNKEEANAEKPLAKDQEGRNILRRNADGSIVVEKNAADHKNDEKRIKKVQNAVMSNKMDDALSKAYTFSHPVESTKRRIKAEVSKKMMKLLIKIMPYILGALAVLFFALILVTVIAGIIMAISDEDDDTLGDGMPYFEPKCKEITVIGDDAGTYDLETYVAGVVQKEVGGFNNIVVDEVFAIAARSYGLSHVDDNCAIENSTSKQAFTSNIGDIAKKAVENTKGIVVVDDSGNPTSVQYDAFAEKSHDDEYYVLKQVDQKIPTSWVKEHISASQLDYYSKHNHGNGLSQWGTYYLATEEDKTYQQILNFYLKDAKYKSSELGIDLENLPDYSPDSSGSHILKGQDLASFLASKGTSIDELNALIAANVDKAGRGTRGGVVAAAMTLIGELNKYNIRVPYYWGGGHGDGIATGAKANWGSSSCTTYANKQVYSGCGLDCSGFVVWALNNGGVKTGVRAASKFRYMSGAQQVTLRANEAVLRPGDLMESSSHVVLVIAVNNSNKTYLVAEASGNSKGVLFQSRSFATSGYWGVDMTGVYGG